MKKISSLPLPAFILTLGGILRISGINASAIWYDEAFSFFMARLPLGKMLAQQWIEYSPPLWSLIERPFAHGPLWVLRLPALVASLASLYVVYLLMQRLNFDQWQQSLSAALVAFLPGLLWTAQDARVYALLSLLYLLAYLFALDGKWRSLGIVSVLMLYAHNTAPFLLVAVYIIALIRHTKEWKVILVTGTLSLLAFVPWLGSVATQSGSFWMAEFDAGWAIHQFIFAYWVDILDASGIFVFLTLVIIFFTVAMDKPVRELATIFSVPFFGMLFVSVFFVNIFFYRPMIPLLMPFALWLGATLPAYNKWTRALTTAAWSLLLVIALLGWDPAARGARLDNATDYIRANWQEGDHIYYITGTVALPFDYYLHDLPHLLMDAEHHTGLMQLSHARAFNIPTGDILELDPLPTRGWVIYPRDVLLDDATAESLWWIEDFGHQVGFLRYSQAADIEIYLIGE